MSNKIQPINIAIIDIAIIDIDGERVQLNRSGDIAILLTLIENKGNAVPFEVLENAIRPTAVRLDVHNAIKRIRNASEYFSKNIINVSGYGYVFKTEN